MARKTFKARVAVNGSRHTVTVPVPPLVGVTKAAEILHLPKSNISRLRTQGRLDAVEVEGPSAPVFLLAEVEELAGHLEEERAARRHA